SRAFPLLQTPSRKSSSDRFCPDGRPRRHSNDGRWPPRGLPAGNEAAPIRHIVLWMNIEKPCGISGSLGGVNQVRALDDSLQCIPLTGTSLCSLPSTDRSNSAKTLTICNIMRPEAVVESSSCATPETTAKTATPVRWIYEN